MTRGISADRTRERLAPLARRPEPRFARSLTPLLAILFAISQAGTAAQSALPKVELPLELKTLVRVKQKVRESLDELPNYTCLQRIERTRLSPTQRRRAQKKMQQRNREGRVEVYAPLDSNDKLELEVALVDGKELYSWPGAERFEDRPLSEIVGFGMVGTGDFAQHARVLFLNNVARLEYAGEEAVGGRKTLRYDYRVSLFMSRFTVFDGQNQTTVPFAGSIWADAETADLVRIEVRAEDVPPTVNVVNSVTQVDYASVALGGKGFLLPVSGRLVTSFQNGAQNINATEFHNCRAFGAESSLSFDATDAAGIETSLALEEFHLPENVSLAVELDTEITSEQSVAGDRVEAAVRADVSRDGEVLVPEGSVLIGRIRRLERFSDPKNHFIVGLAFTELRTPNRRAKVQTELVRVTPFDGFVEQFGEERTTLQREGGSLSGQRVERTTVESFTTTPVPGTSELYIRANRFRMPRGLRMVWRTLPDEP